MDREIKFGIDIILDTHLISIPLYRMAPAKLRELKENLKDLLDKGFVRPSVSGVHQCCLYARKMVCFECPLNIGS